jgi:integrase
MRFRMITPRVAKSGSKIVRKAIPKDVREDYQRLYGAGWEAKLSVPADIREQDAKIRISEFTAEVETRIAALRAAARGEGQSLTQRVAWALAGEWYNWFVARHNDNPGIPEHWEELWEALIGLLENYKPDWVQGDSYRHLDTWIRDPEVRAGIRPQLADEAKTAQFLASKGVVLNREAMALFLDCVLDEFMAALLLLERRAHGDYEPDTRPTTFPPFTASPRRHQQSGLTPWALFKAYVDAKKPGNATINRWRAVFKDLEKHFAEREAGSIDGNEAQAWAEGLLNEKRSPETVNDIWCNAARSVFAWAVKTRKLSSNPFKGMSVTQPRKARTRPKHFLPDEITLILKSASSFDSRPKRPFDAAKRWVPWLCAYTGARAGEMTQLRAADVIKQEGVWTVQITPEAGTVKTMVLRTVPIHEHLVEQGFIEFAKSRGDGPLFYNTDSPLRATTNDPTNPPRARSVKTRERLAAWVRQIGITDKAVRPNHAWRHTFKGRAARAEIEPGMRDAICGHRPRTVADEYETPTVEDMAVALARFPRYEISEP